MSSVPENPMTNTKITNPVLFCRKLYQSIVWPCTNGAILDFAAIFKKNSLFEEYLSQISYFYVNLKVVFSYKAYHGHGDHLGFMQIKKVISPATGLNLFYTSM